MVDAYSSLDGASKHSCVTAHTSERAQNVETSQDAQYEKTIEKRGLVAIRKR